MKEDRLLSRRGRVTSALGVGSIPFVRAPALAVAIGVEGFSPFLLSVPVDGPDPLTRRCTLFRNPFMPRKNLSRHCIKSKI